MGAAFLLNFIRFLLYAYWLMIIVRIFLSYIERDPTRRSTISQLLFALTEPILAPVRRFLPQGGTVAVIAGSRHASTLDQPTQVNQLLHDFITTR